MGPAMSGADHDEIEGNQGENPAHGTGPAAGTDRSIFVALGRRIEVIGDLLLPAEPSDCSRATSRDIAQRLEEWQGPGIVIICGRLVAPSCQQGAGPAASESTPSMSNTTAGPPRSPPVPVRQVQFARSWSAASGARAAGGGTKAQPNGALSAFRGSASALRRSRRPAGR